MAIVDLHIAEKVALLTRRRALYAILFGYYARLGQRVPQGSRAGARMAALRSSLEEDIGLYGDEIAAITEALVQSLADPEKVSIDVGVYACATLRMISQCRRRFSALARAMGTAENGWYDREDEARFCWTQPLSRFGEVDQLPLLSTSVLLLLARIAHEAGHDETAIALHRKGISLGDGQEKRHFELCWPLLMAREDLPVALKLVGDYLRRAPLDKNALLRQWKTALRAGDHDAMFASWKPLLAQGGVDAAMLRDALRALTETVMKGPLDKARAMRGSIALAGDMEMRRSPELQQPMRVAAVSFVSRQMFVEALEMFRWLGDISEGAGVHGEVVTLLRMGQVERAQERYAWYGSHNIPPPSVVTEYMAAGRMYQGRYDEALAMVAATGLSGATSWLGTEVSVYSLALSGHVAEAWRSYHDAMPPPAESLLIRCAPVYLWAFGGEMEKAARAWEEISGGGEIALPTQVAIARILGRPLPPPPDTLANLPLSVAIEYFIAWAERGDDAGELADAMGQALAGRHFFSKTLMQSPAMTDKLDGSLRALADSLASLGVHCVCQRTSAASYWLVLRPS
ncbi:MAG: hypothetical protein HQK87_00785 [Nitrospinae bacterium]|nr:hypothetical protein [Nitrospinota bacterium]